MVLIFANGDLDNDDGWKRPFFQNPTAIIAADGGARHLHALNQPPDIIIGDMDSLSADVRDWLIAANTTFITHPPAKDETDLELALRYAAETYDDDIIIFAALGGRLDQMLGNIHLLTHPALHGRDVRLVTRYQQAWITRPTSRRLSLSKTEADISTSDRLSITATTSRSSAFAIGDTLSLIPLNGDVKVCEVSGLRWSLHDEWLRFGETRGISNVITAVSPTITIEKGTLLCVHTQKEWTR